VTPANTHGIQQVSQELPATVDCASAGTSSSCDTC
jgi:hypothetical protein